MINVAVISGGYSDEKIISKKSAETVLENLSSSKYNIYSVIIFTISITSKISILSSIFKSDKIIRKSFKTKSLKI